VLFPSTNADMTLPSVERERLILVASFRRIPVAPVLLCRSEPWSINKYEQNSLTDHKKQALKSYWLFLKHTDSIWSVWNISEGIETLQKSCVFNKISSVEILVPIVCWKLNPVITGFTEKAQGHQIS
jgi:hypothetical protein